MKKPKEEPSIGYLPLHLSSILHFFITEAMKDENWTVEAIDPSRDIVVFKKYPEIRLSKKNQVRNK